MSFLGWKDERHFPGCRFLSSRPWALAQKPYLLVIALLLDQTIDIEISAAISGLRFALVWVVFVVAPSLVINSP